MYRMAIERFYKIEAIGCCEDGKMGKNAGSVENADKLGDATVSLHENLQKQHQICRLYMGDIVE